MLGGVGRVQSRDLVERRLRAVGPDRAIDRRRKGRDGAMDLADEIERDLVVGELLPVDHPVDEVDRIAIGGEGHQDSAVERVESPLVEIFRLEADRRAVGDDLQIMVGEARQQGPAGDLADMAWSQLVQLAFAAKSRAEEDDLRILAVLREIEKNAVRAEIGDIAGLEIADRRVGAAVQQRHPIIIGANVHPALVEADLGRPLHHRLVLAMAVRGGLVLEFLKAVHIWASSAAPD